MVEQSEFQNKLEYIARHEDEILPTSTHAETIKAIYELVQDVKEHHGGVWRFVNTAKFPQPSIVEAILQEAETKVFVWSNPNADADAKRVVFTMDNPGAFAALMPLVFAFKRSARCRSIEIIANNFAAECIRENESGGWFGFTQVRSVNIAPGKPTPVLVDVLSKGEGSADIVFASTSAGTNGPETVALFGGKSNLGAKKLYFVVDAWGGTNLALGNREHMDDVDCIFCNDVFAKRITEKELPDYPSERIYATGTGQLDSLELECGAMLMHEGREKLGLDEETLAVLYVGDKSADYSSIMPGIADPDIAQKTFAQALKASIAVARAHPDNRYAVLVRSHPRDDREQELHEIERSVSLPENLRMVPATRALYRNINEVAYPADVIVSIMSTENFKAPLRGRTAAFLGFAERGMGKDALERIYSSETLDAVREMPGLAIVSSQQELAE